MSIDLSNLPGLYNAGSNNSYYIYKYIWLYIIIYDYIWLYIIIYDYIWLWILYVVLQKPSFYI